MTVWLLSVLLCSWIIERVISILSSICCMLSTINWWILLLLLHLAWIVVVSCSWISSLHLWIASLHLWIYLWWKWLTIWTKQGLLVSWLLIDIINSSGWHHDWVPALRRGVVEYWGLILWLLKCIRVLELYMMVVVMWGVRWMRVETTVAIEEMLIFVVSIPNASCNSYTTAAATSDHNDKEDKSSKSWRGDFLAVLVCLTLAINTAEFTSHILAEIIIAIIITISRTIVAHNNHRRASISSISIVTSIASIVTPIVTTAVAVWWSSSSIWRSTL